MIVADNGADGIALSMDEQPDAILIDVAMPEINGFQAARQLTHNVKTRHIPVIMVSRSLQEADETWAIKQGARDILKKPVTQQNLLEALDKILTAEPV